MESKENYPFIYFLMESNTVFVYKIKTHNYLNASDLLDYREWEAYKLQHQTLFKKFNHEESESIEGLEFYLEHDQ